MSTFREAAGVAVFTADGLMLLGRHAHDGRWATIGGSLESGETPSAAAQRELREEVGLSLSVLQSIGRFGGSPIYDVTYPNGDVITYAVEMFAAVVDDRAQGQPDGVEILDIAWVGRDDLGGMDLAPDMVEIIPAAFLWFESRSRRPGTDCS